MQFNKNRHGLGYDKDDNFHILDYSKPIKFVSGGFLDKEISEINEEKPKCQHCNHIVTWKINVLISILVNIVARRIIQRINAPKETNLQD
jgi:hypothetical protein